MKKKIIIGLVIAASIALVAFTATSLAASPQDSGQTYFQQMWTACRNGDWQGMWDAMRGAQAAGQPVCPAYNSTSGAGGCGGGNIGTGTKTLY